MAKFDREWYVDSQVKRADAAGDFSVDTTPLTSLLLEYLDTPGNGLESLRPEHVKPSLKKYLRWRVVFHNDTNDARTVPDLKIGVSAKIYHDEGEPTYEEYPDVVSDILPGASRTAIVTA
ncbi:hypothetical protein B0T26DRAFT_746609 [Lasiosphaeria miniovina]|uniref:Tyrosinase C-terminal domain-containing protein n=1 Tax=Lasiosphaeria miniovina TaxID=1954250 RepID=A0AA40BIB4_9PEZI|nr:uncharacterized protein B0T26DRAFT_746609 [Lasiosphaeria miniovina]KAK0734739.1 hypothetical protein B0T26DRAFT_746609 [Lasiosphaeria miniovina]